MKKNPLDILAEYTNRPSTDPDVFLDIISSTTGVPADEIVGRTRHRPVPSVRHLYWACLREYNNWSYLEIAHHTGYNHTTIISGAKAVPKEVISAVGELLQ